MVEPVRFLLCNYIQVVLIRMSRQIFPFHFSASQRPASADSVYAKIKARRAAMRDIVSNSSNHR